MSTDITTYKILLIPDHLQFSETGVFHGNPRDIEDGFIHMCATKEQLPRLLNKYYQGIEVKIYELKFPFEDIIFEESNNQMYPHLYGKPITMENVVSYY